MTDTKLLALFRAVMDDSGGDELTVARALFEAGRLARPRRSRRVPPPAPTAAEKRRAAHANAVPFLLRRWAHLLDIAAMNNATTVAKMLGRDGCARLPPALEDACLLLHDLAGLTLDSIGAIVGASHTAARRAIWAVRADEARRARLLNVAKPRRAAAA